MVTVIAYKALEISTIVDSKKPSRLSLAYKALEISTIVDYHHTHQTRYAYKALEISTIVDDPKGEPMEVRLIKRLKFLLL